MELEGVVQNGVIVPQGGCSLPEGTRVRVVPSNECEGKHPDVSQPADQALIESIRASKGIDPLPADYDFLDALNANRGLGQRPLFDPVDKGRNS